MADTLGGRVLFTSEPSGAGKNSSIDRHSCHLLIRLSITLVALVVVAAGCGSPSPAAVPSPADGQSRSSRAASGAAGAAGAPPVSKLSLAAAQGRVTRRGAALFLDGRRWVFDGVDDYSLSSDSGQDVGCGSAPTSAEIDTLFARLPPGSVVRTWAFQPSAGTNPTTGRRDWAGLDRVVAAAAAHGVKLILSLGSQDGTCDGGAWKGLSWYDSGYLLASRSASGQAPSTSGQVSSGQVSSGQVSYEQWVAEVVTRYRHSSAVAMYEPINEPEASTCAAGFTGSSCYGHLACPSEAAAAHALLGFFDAIGGEIHRIDPAALVEEGTIGSGQCGTADRDYATVGASPGLDVLSVHDYSAPTAILSGDRFNGQRVRLAQAAEIHKPIIAGEIGIEAAARPPRSGHDAATCPDVAQRAVDLERKADADLAAGYSGALVWDYMPGGDSAGCTYDVGPTDPYLSWLARA